MTNICLERNRAVYLLVGLFSFVLFFFSLFLQEKFAWTYALTSVLCVFFSYLAKHILKKRNSPFFITASSWIILSLIASIPLFSFQPNFAFSYFDSVSQLTNTGTSLLRYSMTNSSLLLWRNCLCFVGGIYSIVFIFSKWDASSPHANSGESSFFPCLSCYLFLTILALFFVRMTGISWFQSLGYAMRISSLSFYAENMGTNNSLLVQTIFSFLTLLSWITFSCFRQQNKKQFLNQTIFSEKFFVLLIALLIIFLSLQLIPASKTLSKEHIFFAATNLLTGSGIDIQEIKTWPPAILLFFLFLLSIYKNETNETGLAFDQIKFLRKLVQKEILISLYPKATIDLQKTKQLYKQKITLHLLLYLIILFLFSSIIHLYGQPLSSSFFLTLATLNNMGLSWDKTVLPFHHMGQEQVLWLTAALWIGRLGFINLFLGFLYFISPHRLEKKT